jgi:hypothetical protein
MTFCLVSPPLFGPSHCLIFFSFFQVANIGIWLSNNLYIYVLDEDRRNNYLLLKKNAFYAEVSRHSLRSFQVWEGGGWWVVITYHTVFVSFYHLVVESERNRNFLSQRKRKRNCNFVILFCICIQNTQNFTLISNLWK